MRIDIETDRQMARTALRDRSAGSGRVLLRQVTALAGPTAELLHHSESPWASVTFSGSRHKLALVFAGKQAMDAADHFIEALPEHEFTIPRQIVADAAILSVDHALLPEPRVTIEAELLLLEDG